MAAHHPPRKAVLIDDEVHVRTVMTSALRSLGFDVVDQLSAAHDAALSVERAEASLVLLDVNMPGLTGADVVRDIVAGSNACVIMLTAVNDPEVIGHCLDAGAAHYILKDSRISEIKTLIESTWRNYHGIDRKHPAG